MALSPEVPSVHRILRVKDRLTWRGRVRTRILSREPLPLNQRVDFPPTQERNGVQIVRTGNDAVTAATYWEDPEERHVNSPRSLARGRINKDPEVGKYVRHLRESVARSMKADGLTSKQAEARLRAATNSGVW